MMKCKRKINKKSLDIESMRYILRFTHSRNLIPTNCQIKNYLNYLKKKKRISSSRRYTRVIKRNQNKRISKPVGDFILSSCITTNGIETTKNIAKRIKEFTGKDISVRTITTYRNMFGYR